MNSCNPGLSLSRMLTAKELSTIQMRVTSISSGTYYVRTSTDRTNHSQLSNNSGGLSKLVGWNMVQKNGSIKPAQKKPSLFPRAFPYKNPFPDRSKSSLLYFLSSNLCWKSFLVCRFESSSRPSEGCRITNDYTFDNSSLTKRKTSPEAICLIPLLVTQIGDTYRNLPRKQVVQLPNTISVPPSLLQNPKSSIYNPSLDFFSIIRQVLCTPSFLSRTTHSAFGIS